ncbi:MAG: FAD-dependent oxidoreductase [Elusimicrobiota bacterium]
MHGFDTIIVGGGILGASSALHLSKQGRRVLILDGSAVLPNPKGSSADHSYLFRLTHGKDEFLSDLSAKTLELWKKLEHETGAELLEQTGMLDLAVGKSRYEESCIKVLRTLKIPFEELDCEETYDRYRTLKRGSFKRALFHPGGGLLWAQRAIEVFTRAAMKRGARTALGVKIVKVLRDKNGIQGLRDSKGKVWKAQDYVFAAGPWTRSLLSDFRLPLRVTSQHTLYLRPPRNQGRYRAPHFPVFSVAGRGIYGFPVHVHGFMKFGREKEGSVCRDPESVDRPDPSFQKACRVFLKDFFPDLASFVEIEDRVHHVTRTPDGDCIIDRLPGCPNAVVAVGFSGRAPMFAPLIGEIAAQLIMGIRPEINLHRFRIDRFRR